MDGLNQFIMNTYNWSALEFRLVIVKILNRFNQILKINVVPAEETRTAN